MTCCELHLAAELALWRESCRSGKQSDGGQRKGGVEFSFLFLLVLSLSSSLSFCRRCRRSRGRERERGMSSELADMTC